MPGPKEANMEQVHYFLCILVNELLRLWTDGVIIVTPKYPMGRRVRVALVAVVCDKPAAHKMGGFGTHSHTNFCTLCWITLQDRATPASFEAGEFGLLYRPLRGLSLIFVLQHFANVQIRNNGSYKTNI